MRTHAAVVTATMMGCLLTALRAEEPPEETAPPAVKKLDERLNAIDARIEELHRQREKVHQEMEQVERLEHRKRELAGLHEEARERLRDYDEQREDEPEGEDETPNAAVRALRDARTHHLAKCRELDNRILAVRDVKDLDTAVALARKLELVRTEWWMVIQHKHEFNIHVLELEEYLAEEGTQEHRRILAQIKDLHTEDMANRVREYELMKARHANAEARQKLLRDFWGEE